MVEMEAYDESELILRCYRKHHLKLNRYLTPLITKDYCEKWKHQ